MDTPRLGTMAATYEGRRPSPVGDPPSRGEIRKLRERLAKYGHDRGRGLTAEACNFLGAAVAQPATVRAQLNRPNIRPTATGHLEVVFATVPIDCLVPDPGNGRVVGATAWPAADASDGQTLKLWAPSDLMVHPHSACEVLVETETVTEAKTVLEEAADRTKQLNPAMRHKIERDGILDPLLCQLIHVQTEDGTSAVALVTRDGSTRCSFAKQAHRAMVHEALFGAGRDLDHRRTRWAEMKRRFESPVGEIAEAELIELRTFLVGVQIVVGFHTHEPRVTVLDAVDDIVRRTHVETSLPWLQVAQSNSQADQMLSALRTHKVIGEEEFLLYGGKLSRETRASKKLPVEPDRVLAQLLKVLGASATRNKLEDLHSVMRRATGQGQIRNQFKADLAGSLGLRQFPVDGRQRGHANQALEEMLRIDALWDEQWADTGRSPEVLLAYALEEFDEASEPGPACRELLVKAAGYLASQGWLKRQIAGGTGVDRDQRAPNMVLESMYRTVHGLHVLGEALAAGRRGEGARGVDAAGVPVEQVGGQVQPLTNEWIRGEFADGVVRNAVAEVGATTSTLSPREKVALHVREVERDVDTIEGALRRARGIVDADGSSYLDRWGWPQGEVVTAADRLHDVARELERMGMRAEAAAGLPPVEQLEMAEAEVLA